MSDQSAGLATRASSRAEGNPVEEIDLGGKPPRPTLDPAITRTRWNWAVWVTVAAVLGGGMVFLSQDAIEVPTSAPRQLLPTPDEVTTSTALSALNAGVISEERFPLARAVGLDAFSVLVGPVQFAGKYWMAGNYDYPSSETPILSSTDGFSWEVEANLSAAGDGWLRVDDIDTFSGVLTVVGSAGRTRGPWYAPATPAQSVIWKSTDGRRWSSIPIFRDEGSMSLDLIAGSEEVLITVYQGPSVERPGFEQIPLELIPGLERGDFNLWPDAYGFRVMAPPGIELFRVRGTQPDVSSGTVRLFRSENLIIWQEVDLNFSIRNLVATPDGGFLSNDSALRYSSDGRSWERTNRHLPLFYQNWGDRLLGLDHSFGTTKLVVVDDQGSATIELPTEIAGRRNEVSISASPGGLAAVLTSQAQGLAEPITRVDGYILAMDNGVLRVEEPTGEKGYAQFDIEGLIPGTYVSQSNSIRFATNEGRTLEFPVSALVDLRATPQRSRFDVLLSDDGITWARPQTGLRAGYVEILGYAKEGFLVGVHNFSSGSGELPLVVYTTGPPG